MRTKPSTRRATNPRTRAISRSGSSSRLAARTAVCRARATSSSDRRRLAEKFVADVLEEGADGARAPAGATQVARMHVVAVVEAPGRPSHSLAHLGRDAGLVVDDPRDGLETDAGQGRDVLHRGARDGPTLVLLGEPRALVVT